MVQSPSSVSIVWPVPLLFSCAQMFLLPQNLLCCRPPGTAICPAGWGLFRSFCLSVLPWTWLPARSPATSILELVSLVPNLCPTLVCSASVAAWRLAHSVSHPSL